MDTYGVIGWPIKHSLSPAMHNAAFKALGIDAEYKLFEVRPEELEDFILNRKDVAGFNITVPHKVKAKEILEKSGQADIFQRDKECVELAGAINTVKRKKDRLEYTNTDVFGFLNSLKEDLKIGHINKNVLLIGCGGAGRAVVATILAGLGGKSKKIYIYDKDNKVISNARDFYSNFLQAVDMLEFISEEKISEVIANCQLLINASPVGMKEEDLPVIDKKLLHKDLSVYDVIYNRETELIKDAKSLGLRCASGLGMLLYQGAHAFEFWTGKKAPVEIMKKALESAIEINK